MIHIYSIQYNKPPFIVLQKKSFDKFINDYSFTVIDNSIEPSISKDIENICRENNINLITPQNKFDSRSNGLHGLSHEVGVNVFLNELKNKHSINDIVILLDHDVFLVSDFLKILETIENSSILTIEQSRSHINYLWPGLIIFNLKNCININELSLNGAQLINGVWEPIDNGVFTDIGGHSFHYLKKYKDELKLVNIASLCAQSFDDINENHVFYHFHDGSQWSKYSDEIWNNKFDRIKIFLQ